MRCIKDASIGRIETRVIFNKFLKQAIIQRQIQVVSGKQRTVAKSSGTWNNIDVTVKQNLFSRKASECTRQRPPFEQYKDNSATA